jgi:WD40 repeat protein
MKTKISLLLIALFFFSTAFAQKVDEVRLGYELDFIKAKLLSASASADGKLLSLVFNNGNVKIFDLESQKFRGSFSTTFKEVHDLRITSDDKIIITASDQVKIYESKTGALLKEFKLRAKAARMDYNATHNIYIVGQMGGSFSAFDIGSLSEIYANKFGGFMINALALHPDARIAAGSFYSMAGKYLVKIFDIRTGEILHTLEKDKYHTLSYDGSGNLLAYGWGDTGTFWFKTYGPSLELVNSFDAPMQEYGYVEAGFTGSKAVFTTSSLTLDAYDLEAKKMVYTSKADKTLLKIVGNYAYPKIVKISSTKFLFTYGNYNIIRLYDAEAADVPMYWFTDGGDEFCAVSKDGRTDGSMDALRNVYWTSRKSKSKTSLEQTFERGFTPKLFNIILAADNQNQADFDVDGLATTIPVLNIKTINGTSFTPSKSVQSVQKTARIEVALTGNTNEIKELRLYHNGKLTRTQPGAPGTSQYEFEVNLSNAFGEENFIAVVAATTKGMESQKAKATIHYKGTSDARPKMYLVTIGINEYKNPKYNLNYAQADADGVNASVKSISSSLFPEVVEFNIRNDEAIKQNIVNTFTEIRGKALEQDLLLVYYAGHGVVAADESGTSDFYLALHDLTQLYGKPDLLAEKALSAAEIRVLTEGINAQKQIFMLDACQSGAALESASKRGVEEEKAIAQLARSTGTFWITASGSEQFATELEKLGHGIFTYTILEGIKGNADVNKDRKLSIRELSVFIEEQVPALTEKFKGSAQYPSSYSFGNDFPIAIY